MTRSTSSIAAIFFRSGNISCRRFVFSCRIATNMFTFLLWCVLFVLCWPVALLAVVLFPLVWLVLLPFRIVGIAVGGVLALVTGLIMLPFRVLSKVL
jgi:hypothetical protein